MWGGRPLIFETGRMARQADGAVLVKYGETVVLCTVVAEKKAKPDQDFFPLTVNYQEKTYAAGKIPGGFFKREGRPSEKETLTSRLIDRPIRPLFPENFRNETQVIATVLSHDLENDPDVVSMIGVSAALTISGIPFLGPIGASRVGYKNGQYILNPLQKEMTESQLDLVVAGTHDAVLMVESEAKELPEDVMLGAVNFGHQSMRPVIDLIIELAEDSAKEPWELTPPKDLADVKKKIAELVEADFRKAYAETQKKTRSSLLGEARSRATQAFADDSTVSPQEVSEIVKKLEKEIVRGGILQTKRRIDGRKLDDVRPIVSEVGVLSRAHGSALFTRGETQALVVTTLGTGDDEQLIDALEGSYHESFMLHYNFPPFSVGETGRFGFTGRREVGHGKLAWRALRPVLPKKEAFPYTLRVVSEITESNGSSSMATVCGASLSLMDAGVPIARPVSGIAMGLIKEGDAFAVISDILGDEDHLGDMDFKVAGTELGVTSLQMDIKITGITSAIMEIALHQAKAGRTHILNEMRKALVQSRAELSTHAPRIVTITINKSKIREVIGTGGKVIREIVETTGAKIDIEDDGTIKIASSDLSKIEAAKQRILSIASDPEVGQIYEGKVVKIAEFGAFVNFFGARDGLVHISEMAPNRVEKVTDVVKEGDVVKVRVLEIDERGKVRLTMRVDEDRSSSAKPRAESGGRNEGRERERGGRGRHRH